jgi:hypothetical protein
MNSFFVNFKLHIGLVIYRIFYIGIIAEYIGYSF